MFSPREKWQRGIALGRRTSNADSATSADSFLLRQSSSVFEEETTDMEVGAYVARLKQKTGLRSLWSGNKFEDFVEGDRTPDVSLSSDDDLDVRLTQKHLENIHLDSDEDELRIDYMRDSKDQLDSNNNIISDESSISEDLHLMQNIHFAELGRAEVDLSDDLKLDDETDFLPNVRVPAFDSNTESDVSDQPAFIFGKNVNLLSANEISERAKSSSLHLKHRDVSQSASVDGSSSESISEVLSSDHPLSADRPENVSRLDMSSQGSVHSSRSNSTNSSPEKSTHTSRKSSRTSRKSSHTSRKSSHSPRKSSHSSRKSSHASQKSGHSTGRYSYDSEQSSTSSRNSRSSNERYSRSTHRKSTLSAKSSPRKEYSSDEVGTLSETSTILSDSPRPKRSPRVRRSRKEDIATQTEPDVTAEVLNFRHAWQFPESTMLASHVVDPAVIDTLTAYNPTSIALHDMMKYHLHLIRNHVDNSRRLYESYSKENLNSNYRYETLENTMKYIKQNRPKVISYEQALNDVLEYGS